jgi:chitodextrinase
MDQLNKAMKNIVILISILFFSLHSSAQVICSATDSTGSGYPTFINAGFDIENPDCEHTSFGAHVTQTYDADLDRNVFVFHSHIVEDNDRCQVFDRVRMEIKGGPNTSLELQHTENSTSYYRWKFRLDENFISASTFNHIFQNKAKGGNDDAFPVLTITPRRDVIEIAHNGGDTGNDLGVLVEADLSLFRGKWVEVFMKQTHSENGNLEISIKDMVTGLTILSYTNDDIDLWRIGADYNRPKWGMYRSKNTLLQDEEIRFADFCISEVDLALCPGEAVLILDTIPPTSPENLVITNISRTTVSLDWDESVDNFGVTSYEIIQNGTIVQSTIGTDTILNNLIPASNYSYTIQAKDAAGNISEPSNMVTATTDAMDVLPDAVSNPSPADNEVGVTISSFLNWETGNNIDSFKVYLGTDNDPPLVSTQTMNSYQETLSPFTTYFWKVVSVNDNGETSSPIWSFTTGDENPDFPWLVFRGNFRPEIETNYYELNRAPADPPLDEIINDSNGSDNTFYGFRSNNNEDFRWRHDFEPSDSVITVVARLQSLTDVNGIIYFEIRGNGWRQKIRINQASIKLEKTSPVLEADLPFNWNREMHLIRIVSDGINTAIYLDEEPAPFIEGISDTPSGNSYFEWGNSGGTDYGAYIDWLVINKIDGYAPNEGSELPEDLFLSSVATLSALNVNGIPLNGFSASEFDYTYETSGTTIPTLSWNTTSELANVIINNPTSVPNTSASLEVTAQDGFSKNTYTINYEGTTSTENPFLNSQISLAPNPADEYMNIGIGKNRRGFGTIHNTVGQQIGESILINESIDLNLSEHSAGVYIFRIKYINGQSATKTFTVSK